MNLYHYRIDQTILKSGHSANLKVDQMGSHGNKEVDVQQQRKKIFMKMESEFFCGKEIGNFFLKIMFKCWTKNFAAKTKTHHI